MISNQADAAVIGGGVIGLAVARALAIRNMEVFVLESESAVGAHTSSRNSEVVHAGFYYAADSLKARLCVTGRRALESYVAKNDVGYRRIGKLVVATSDEEVDALESYRARGIANGVEGLEIIDADEARALEPEVRCVRALWSPATGIIDSHGLMAALRRDLEQRGSHVVLRSPVTGGRVTEGGIELSVGGESPSTVLFKVVVNAAGLWAQSVVRALQGFPSSAIPPSYFARGHYFVLDRPSPFRHLVYPLATRDFLGVHVTLDLAGAARFGPDVEWVERVDYSFDERRMAAFEAAIRRYWPGLPHAALVPGYVGIRPKLGPAGSPPHDFVVQAPVEHGVPGLVNLFGIESPGLTAALAIADAVASLL
ncbi:MAG TPA: NAD(P)/FAD-dependent oxidoreductase [Myxococcaceae bacterium]|nr:NAD(P)/FAD-dependent oxidoreductase [Myxococcaceae bacterium]